MGSAEGVPHQNRYARDSYRDTFEQSMSADGRYTLSYPLRRFSTPAWPLRGIVDTRIMQARQALVI